MIEERIYPRIDGLNYAYKLMLQDRHNTETDPIVAPNHKSDAIEKPTTEIEDYRKETTVSSEKEFYMTWENLDLTIDIKHKKKSKDDPGFVSKKLLNNISGYAKSGECLAIMGGSGAGKSTFLNILSDKFIKTRNMKLSGEVKLNNQPFKWEKFRHITGFVMQRDIFFDEMRVKEVFDFTIAMRSPDLNQEAKRKKEKDMIELLKLQKAENNFIGGLLVKGISGGEKRRLNLGAEQLTDPKILFLDEPTSGLDSYTSFIIVENLRKLAASRNMIIIYTIHQPSTEIAQLFSNLLILHKGTVMYFGKKSEALGYYAELGYKAPSRKNPVEYFLEVFIKSGEDTAALFADKFDKMARPAIEQVIKSAPNEMIEVKVKKASFCQQFGALTKRSFNNFVRNPFTLHGRIFQSTMLGFIFSLMYGGLEDLDASVPLSIYNRVGAFFFLSGSVFVGYFQQTMIVCKLKSPE